MKIEIRYRRPMRLWQRRLLDALRADGHDVSAKCVPGSKSAGFGVGLLLALQRRLIGLSPSLFDPVSDPTLVDRAESDLVICLDGTSSPTDGALEPLFDGQPGEAALIDMVARQGAPVARIHRRTTTGATTIVRAALAVEDRDSLARALDQTLARLPTLIVQAVRRMAHRAPAALDPDADQAESARPLAHMISGMTRKLWARGTRADRGPQHWRIGYRQRVADIEEASGLSTSKTFDLIADDGARFYADPMAFEHGGRRFIFFEEFPYATSKGVISLVEIAADGAAGGPQTVLEQPSHLSYPFVFEHNGAIYMLPEMGAAGRLQLFRADPFPNRWVPDRVLIENCIVSDATPVWHQDRWWVFATLSDDDGSTWDALGLFHAPDLFGPWTPHADNPVLVDAGAARPAGAMWHEDGVLMRVAQDCREGYGRGLAICRVDRLNEYGYAQTVVKRLGPPDGSDADGVHTFNRSQTLEVVDLRYPHADRLTFRTHSAALREQGRD